MTEPNRSPIQVEGEVDILTMPSVRVKDIDMPFVSMVVFMVKWAIASIPAMIILVITGLVVFSVLSGIMLAGG